MYIRFCVYGVYTPHTQKRVKLLRTSTLISKHCKDPSNLNLTENSLNLPHTGNLAAPIAITFVKEGYVTQVVIKMTVPRSRPAQSEH